MSLLANVLTNKVMRKEQTRVGREAASNPQWDGSLQCAENNSIETIQNQVDHCSAQESDGELAQVPSSPQRRLSKSYVDNLRLSQSKNKRGGGHLAASAANLASSASRESLHKKKDKP